MRTTVIFAVFGIMTLALASVALGQTRVDRRQAAQERRIDRGVASGQLTARETWRLQRGQAHVQQIENRARTDGVVTSGEKIRIEHAQDVQSGRIYREKHDR